MGCCNQRSDFDDQKFPKPSDAHPLSFPTPQSPDLPVQSFESYIKQNDLKSISQFIKKTEKSPSISPIQAKPNIETVGGQSLQILISNLNLETKSHFSLLTSLLPDLVSNLESENEEIQFLSFDLIELSVRFLSESSIFHLVRLGIFEKLLRVKRKNSALLAFKIYENRERLQRIFLKNHGIYVICICLINFENDLDEVLTATLNLVMVRSI